MPTIHQWALQDAKSHFSEVVKKAEQEGPQVISVRGRPAVVMISQKEYAALIAPEESLVDFLRKSPLTGLDIEFERDKSLPREDIDLKTEKIGAGAFKAKCLGLLDEVEKKHLQLVITKHGKSVAMLTPIENKKSLFGCMKGSVIINGDIVASTDEEWEADK